MKNMRFDEVVFADDFFRSSANLLHSHPLNRRFLRSAFELPARRLGLRCRDLCAASDGGTLDIPGMMHGLSLTPSAGGWARSCIADLDPLVHQGLLPRLTPNQLVIGWGMTPALLGHLDRAGISFIDVEISPVRFGSHLSFNMRTNDRLVKAVLAALRIDEEVFWNEATALAGFFARRGAGHLFDPGLTVGLFCGQCAIDLALVCGGEILRPLDVVDGARALAKEVDLLVIRPHPYEPDLRALSEFAEQIPNAVWSDANIYALMCADNLRFVSALTSGATREAKYFLKEGLQLAHPDRDNPKRLPAACSDWIPVGPDVLSLEALSAICDATGQLSRPTAHMPTDTLDRAFGTRWGLDNANHGLPPSPRPGDNEVVRFGAGNAATAWLSFGWSAPEPEGTWTVGEHACIVVPMPAGEHGPQPPLQLLIEGQSFAGKPGRRPEIRIRIRIGAEAPIRWPGNRLLFDWPETEASRALVIDIGILNPTSPCECGLNQDCRLLGWQLKAIRFQRQDARHPARPMTAPALAAPAAPAQRRAAPIRKAGIAVAVVMLLAAAGSVLGLADGTATTQVAGKPSSWAMVRDKVSANVETMRTDLHAIFKRHEI